MSTFAHHGLIYVPLGYAHTFAQATDLSAAHGGDYLTYYHFPLITDCVLSQVVLGELELWLALMDLANLQHLSLKLLRSKARLSTTLSRRFLSR